MNLEELRRRATESPTLENLRALADGVAAALRALNTEAGDGDLDEAQTERWNELEAEHTATTGRIETEERAERVRESRARWGANFGGGSKDDDRDVRSLARGELQSRALKVVDRPETRQILEGIDTSALSLGADFNPERAQAHIAKLVRTNSRNFRGDAFARYLIATETPEYRSAFGKLIARGSNAVLTAEEGRAVELVEEMRAAMNITTDGQGGYGIPVIIDPTIILTGQGHPNDFFNICRVENITNDEWKGVSSAGATSYWTTEGVTFTGGEPTLAQPSVTTKKITTLVKYTFEVQGDYPNFASEMATVMAASHQETLVSGFTQGPGNAAQPTGIVTAVEANAATSKVMVTTDGSLGAVDFYAVRDALPIRFRAASRWMMHTTVNSAARQFGTNDANFTVDMTADGIQILLGRQVNLNDYMDSAIGSGGVTSASDVTPAILGDWRNFLIANRVGATIETVQHVLDTTTGNPTGQRATFMWARIGSNIVNPNAFRYLHQSA